MEAFFGYMFKATIIIFPLHYNSFFSINNSCIMNSTSSSILVHKEFFTITNVDVKLYYDEVPDPSQRHSSDIRNTRIFWRCSKRSIFKYLKIWKCEYVKYVNTMSKTLSKLSLSCAQTQRQRWSSIFKYFQVFFKKPKKTYNTRMFESNWEYVTTMARGWHLKCKCSWKKSWSRLRKNA
jgi:hypothetical protein